MDINLEDGASCWFVDTSEVVEMDVTELFDEVCFVQVAGCVVIGYTLTGSWCCIEGTGLFSMFGSKDRSLSDRSRLICNRSAFRMWTSRNRTTNWWLRCLSHSFSFLSRSSSSSGDTGWWCCCTSTSGGLSYSYNSSSKNSNSWLKDTFAILELILFCQESLIFLLSLFENWWLLLHSPGSPLFIELALK